MKDLYLRFESSEQMLEVMTSLNLTYQDEEHNTRVSTGGHEYALWELGHIPNKTGYHVNMRVIDANWDTTPLEPYQVFPQNPVCTWA